MYVCVYSLEEVYCGNCPRVDRLELFALGMTDGGVADGGGVHVYDCLGFALRFT